MNRRSVAEAVVHDLERELAAILQAARSAHEAATHDESRAEDAHDTRGIEASYLAGAQSQRALELQALIASLRQLGADGAAKDSAIGPGSLVQLESERRKSWAWIAPRGGGIQTQVDGETVRVVSPESPLGEELVGRHAGDEVEIEAQSSIRTYRVLQVK